MEKYCTAGQATDDNMAHAHCMLDNKGYKYTHSGCVIIVVFPLQQWFTKRLNITLYFICPSCLIDVASGKLESLCLKR